MVNHVLTDLFMQRVKDKPKEYILVEIKKELEHRDEVLHYKDKAIDRFEVKIAGMDDPEGKICTHCGGENDFADDCGWFYVHDTESRKHGYCCWSCWKGPPGRNHIARYGLGER